MSPSLSGVAGPEEPGRDGICILILSKKSEDEFKMETRSKLNLLHVRDGDWTGDRKETEAKTQNWASRSSSTLGSIISAGAATGNAQARPRQPLAAAATPPLERPGQWCQRRSAAPHSAHQPLQLPSQRLIPTARPPPVRSSLFRPPLHLFSSAPAAPLHTHQRNQSLPPSFRPSLSLSFF